MALAIRPKSSHAVVDLAQVYLQSFDWKTSQLLFDEALRLDPVCAPAWHYLGVIRFQTGDFAEAERHLRRSLELDPGFVNSHLMLAMSLRAVGRFDEAVSVLRTATGRDPERADLWCELGQLFAKQGRFEDARGALQKCREVGAARGEGLAAFAAAALEQIETYVEKQGELAQVGSDLSQGSGRRLYPLAEPALLTGRSLTAARILKLILAEAAEAGAEVPVRELVFAVRAAASAGAGLGKEPVHAAEAAEWRERARTWLSQALDAAEDLAAGPERDGARREIAALLADPDLSGVREPARLAAWPPEETKAWTALWERVRAHLWARPGH
jgi:tetratricopeptide (TPR) repeat protein